MPGQPWLKYQAVSPAAPTNAPWLKYQQKGSMIDMAPKEIPEDPASSPVTAATTGFMEGAMPFASAIGGAGKTALDAITGTRGPLAGGDLEDLMDDYRTTRDSIRKDTKKSAEENPKTAFMSTLAGGVANPLFKNAHSLGDVMKAGAVQAIGNSDTDLTQPDQDLKGLGIEAGLGAAGGALGYGVGKVIPKIWDGVKYFGKKGLTNLGPSGEAIEARLAGKAQDNAKSYPELAEHMGDTLKNLSAKTSDLSDEAAQTLSPDPNIPKQAVTSVIDDQLSKLGLQGKTIGATDKQISNTLTNLKEDLSGLDDQISEKDLKSLIRKMDDNINWDDQSQNKQNTVLEGIRTQLDQALKFRNPQYKAAMVPVADQTRLLDNLRRQFNFRGVPGKGLTPTDTTATKIQSSLRDNKAVTEGQLKQLADLTGNDYSDMANDYQLSQQFQRTGAQGSKRTNLGAALGSGVGYMAGGLMGAGAGASLGSLAGGAMDAYGGKVAGKLIDSYLKAGNSEAFGQFGPALKKAALQGPQSLGVVTSMLMNNPAFKKQLETLMSSQNQ
jgi:hypothetical protein